MTENIIKCDMCGAEFSEDEMEELEEFKEPYYRDENAFICPDCYDAFRRMTFEEMLDYLLDYLLDKKMHPCGNTDAKERNAICHGNHTTKKEKCQRLSVHSARKP